MTLIKTCITCSQKGNHCLSDQPCLPNIDKHLREKNIQSGVIEMQMCIQSVHKSHTTFNSLTPHLRFKMKLEWQIVFVCIFYFPQFFNIFVWTIEKEFLKRRT